MPYLKVEDNFSATIVGNYSTTASTITLSNVPTAVSAGWLTVYDFDGNQYEKIYFGGVSGSNITSVLRGLSFTTNSQTEISGNKKELKNGMTVKLSVSQNYINDLTDVVNGTKEVGGLMKNPSSRTITDNRHIIDKEYADNLAIAGSPKATETVYGIAKLSSAAADPTAPVVVNNEEVSAAGGTGAGENKIVKANASGYIDKDYIEVTANKGLEFSGNALQGKAGTGIVLNASGINVDVGTTDGKIVQMTTGDKLPAVDGSNLTNLGLEYFSGTGSKLNKSYYNYQFPYYKPTVIDDVLWNLSNISGIKYQGNYAFNISPTSGTSHMYMYANIIDKSFATLNFGGKNLIIEFSGIISGTTGSHTYFGLFTAVGLNYNNAAYDAATFSIDSTSGNLYAHTSAGGGGADHLETLINGVTVTNSNLYRIEYIVGTSIKFYINGTLVATHTTNLPNKNPILVGWNSTYVSAIRWFTNISAINVSVAR